MSGPYRKPGQPVKEAERLRSRAQAARKKSLDRSREVADEFYSDLLKVLEDWADEGQYHLGMASFFDLFTEIAPTKLGYDVDLAQELIMRKLEQDGFEVICRDNFFSISWYSLRDQTDT